MGEGHCLAQIQAFAGRGAPDERSQGPTVPVVALQVGVPEGHHLREEGVEPHELVEGVFEVQALLLWKCPEPLHRRLQESVNLGVGARHPRAQERRHRGGHLRLAQDVVLVQPEPRVVEDIGVGRRRHGSAVVGLEGRDDVVGLVAEVEDEGVRFQGVDAIEA